MTNQTEDRPNAGTVRRQQTLKNAISCSGVGLHSGSPVRMTLRPAAPNTGVLFVRRDAEVGIARIPARWDQVADTALCTVLANEAGVKVATVEHLLAAFAGCGVDNVLVELDAGEVPAMDGSAAPFVFLIECAGVVRQTAARRALRILKRVAVEENGRAAWLEPAARFRASFEIDFASDAVVHKVGHFELDESSFKRDIARARTFGFERDVQRLRDLGLALGGSLDNAVVIGVDDRVLNQDGLRFADEFVRHKVLDAFGDLYLAGAPILGHFHGVRSGHQLNNRLLRAVFADAAAWRMEYAVAEPGEAGADPQPRFAAAG